MMLSARNVIGSTIGLLAIGLAALLFFVATTLWLSNRAVFHATEVGAIRTLQSITTTFKESLLSAESSQRGYILTGSEIYLSPYDSSITAAKVQLTELTRLLASRSDRQPLLARLVEISQDKFEEMANSINQRRTGDDAAALDTIRSNRGKALMDEANMMLSALILETEERLSDAVAVQRANTFLLRRSSLAASFIILLVSAISILIIYRFTAEAVSARDSVTKMNETLEKRVADRTAELSTARDRAELLLSEVNHRVSNSLSLVSSLIRMNARQSELPEVKSALEETNSRIQAIAQMHRHLFTTNSVDKVNADQYLGSVLEQLKSTILAEKSNVKLQYALQPLALPTNYAVNLGIVLTEWITNAVKYAYGDHAGEIRASLFQSSEMIELVVEDDGRGRTEDQISGTGMGTKVVNTIANMMRGTAEYLELQPGTRARLVIPPLRLS